MKSTIPRVDIQHMIYFIRGQKVMLDRDLAALYGVETFNLNKALGRNLDRFPEDFAFRLSKAEYDSLRFQIGILKRGQHAKYLPWAFTEHGVAMLSSVLRSKRAVQVNIAIVRAFIDIRRMISSNGKLAQKLRELEGKVQTHDSHIKSIITAIRELLDPPVKSNKQIGFRRP